MQLKYRVFLETATKVSPLDGNQNHHIIFQDKASHLITTDKAACNSCILNHRYLKLN